MEGTVNSVTRQSDITDFANVFANALLDGKKIVVDDKGTIRLGSNEVTPYSQEELDKATVAVIAHVLNRRDGASTPIFDQSQIKRISEFYIQEVKEIGEALAQPADNEEALEAQRESIFRALEKLSGRPTYENSTQLNINNGQAMTYIEQHLQDETIEFPFEVREFLNNHKEALERDRERILANKLKFNDKPDDRNQEVYMQSIIFSIEHLLHQQQLLRQEREAEAAVEVAPAARSTEV